MISERLRAFSYKIMLETRRCTGLSLLPQRPYRNCATGWSNVLRYGTNL
jgi:hypothetical protein